MTVGEALAIHAALGGQGPRVVGRVSKIDGGMVEIMTPHGSTLAAGLLYTRTPTAGDLRVHEDMEADPYPRRPDLKAAMLRDREARP